MFADVQHPICEPPLVIKPAQHLHHGAAGYARLTSVDDAGMGVVIEIGAGQKLIGVAQYVFSSKLFNASTEVFFLTFTTMSIADTFMVGTRMATELNLPSM